MRAGCMRAPFSFEWTRYHPQCLRQACAILVQMLCDGLVVYLEQDVQITSEQEKDCPFCMEYYDIKSMTDYSS